MAEKKQPGNETISFNYNYSDRFELEDVENRRLYLNCDIDENIFDNVWYHIMRYNRIDKDKAISERKPIIIYINTEGGNVSDGFGLIDAIKNSRTPVYTVNIALAASMGFLIYIAGHKRYAMPHSEFLMHDGSGLAYDSTAKLRDRIEFETGEMAQSIKDYVIDNTNIDEQLYDEKYRTEWYFLPNTGREIGVVDYIIGQDCGIEEIV